jgi:RNA polymerase sigma-70 factor (ECF subfamily)
VKGDFTIEITREHYDEVASYVRRRVLAPALADDLVQLTFLEALRSWGDFKEERGRLIAWLIGIASNIIRHHYRDERRRLAAYGRVSLDRSTHAEGWEEESVAAIDRRRRDAVLARAMATLPTELLEIITMHYWAGLTCAEIGLAIGMSESTAKRRLERARERVRSALATLDGDRRE